VSPERAPLVALSVTFRDAPTAVRSRANLPFSDDVLGGLKAHGVAGLVEIHTCARSLWVASAENTEWAGALLESNIATRLGGVRPRVLTDAAAFQHVLAVAIGLDSFVQGESDIGGQVSEAFQLAREAGRTDVTLNLLEQSIARLLAEGRIAGFIRPGRGLGHLAVATLIRLGADRTKPVGVVGAGAIGERVVASLARAEWAPPEVYNRTVREGVRPLSEIGEHDAIVVCTAGPARWLRLPPARFVIDLGAPPQVDGPAIDLDELLSGEELRLSPERLHAAQRAVHRELATLLARVRSSARRRGLAGVVALRDRFLEEELDALLGDAVSELPEEQRRRVREAARGALRQYSHRMLSWMKDEMLEEGDAG
jgi:glutamyl-tRNA reductase